MNKQKNKWIKQIVNYFEELPLTLVVPRSRGSSRSLQYQKNLLQQTSLEMEYKICVIKVSKCGIFGLLIN
jgi:hypothetical protein